MVHGRFRRSEIVGDFLQGIASRHQHLENTQAALSLRNARNLIMKDVEIHWEKPESPTWKAGLQVESVKDLLLDGVNVATRMTLKDAENATVRNSGTETIQISGVRSRKIRLLDTEGAVTSSAEVAKDAIVRR